jgi:hypothetical protein
MNCINRKELDQFLAGTLDTRRLLAVDEHLGSCPECRAAVSAMPARRALAADLSAELLGVRDCPEYEELSAYIENALSSDHHNAITAHSNACELCARDLARISEMRSHAAMRDRIEVRPGQSRKAGTARVFWKWAAAALGSAAVVVGVAVSLSHFASTPAQIAKVRPAKAHTAPVVAVNAPADQHNTPVPVVTNNAKPPTVTPHERVITSPPAHNQPAAPQYVAVLKDGSNRVVRDGANLELRRANGEPAGTALEARVAAAVDQKLRTGRVRLPKPVEVASAELYVRGTGYNPPATAPKLVGPISKIMLTTKPTLQWTAVELAESYKVRVVDSEGRVVFEKETNDTSVTLPTVLERGRTYAWQVGARFAESDSWYKSASARFRVISDEDYSSILSVKRQSPGSHVALGALYESLGLSDEAAGEYRALLRENPNSRLARKLFEDK